jgi:hypothetical protein
VYRARNPCGFGQDIAVNAACFAQIQYAVYFKVALDYAIYPN